MKIEKNDLIILLVQLLLLGLVIFLSGFVRWSTMSASTILDYDPWWYYRHAIEIMNNNMIPPKWDILSTYPPGRPYDYQLGWEYTMIIFYKIGQIFSSAVSFLYMAKLSPIIMVALGAVSAFLLGSMLSNKWGGLFTALFIVLAPTFIGVSMAGYIDNDPVVVFYTFLCIFSVFLALKKRSVNYYALAILTNLIFVFNWGGGWLILMFFIALLFAVAGVRLLENSIQERKISLKFGPIWSEILPMLKSLVIILVVTNIFVIAASGSIFYRTDNIIDSLGTSLGFIGSGEGLLVNISVAELYKINILTVDGFNQIAARVGLAPFVVAIIGLPLFAMYKLYKKIKISTMEIFLFLWFSVTFCMIIFGVRFSLLFALATSAAAGYVIGNIISFFKRDFNSNQAFIWVLILGIILVLTLKLVSDAIQIGYSSTGMEVDQNWLSALDWLKQNADKDALITTWWDPGHIITGYTGLKVHADGAHCGPVYCYPYYHNDRIQDMGFVFSTTNESQAVDRLKKYMALTPEQCQTAREMFGSFMPADACKPVSEMYVIASADLIGKYYWLSCFPTYDFKTKQCQGRNFAQLSYSSTDQSGNVIYGSGVVTLTVKDNKVVAILNLPQQGIKNVIVRQVIYFQNGQQILSEYTNTTNVVDGMVFVDPSFQAIIFMDAQTRDSVFTKMYFFNGEGLTKFKPVYVNSEIKIFKVLFS